MTKRGVALFCTVLLAWALANTYVIHAYGRGTELFPMTAWQMFSGRPREFLRRFTFEVVPTKGERPIEVPGGHLVGERPGSTTERRILQAVWRSHDNGCPDYRLSDYPECREHRVEPWRIPRGIADDWVEHSIEYLGLAKRPYAITLVKVETPLKPRKPIDRARILTWRPGSGSYRTEPAR